MIGFDSETELIAPGLRAPPLVCVSSWYEDQNGASCSLLHANESEDFVADVLERRYPIIAHNAAFDMSVQAAKEPWFLPKIFAAYEAGAIICTMVRQKLIDIANGCLRAFVRDGEKTVRIGYSLAETTKRLLGEHVEKEDTWRLRYGELKPYPITWWPEDAKSYALNDARLPLHVWRVQEQQQKYLVDQERQFRASFWLTLLSAWGFHTDAQKVRELADVAASEQRSLIDLLVREGLLRAPRPLKSGPRKGEFTEPTRDTKAAEARMRAAYAKKDADRARAHAEYEAAIASNPNDPRFYFPEHVREEKPSSPCPLTPTGKPQLDDEACKESGDPVLQAYGRYSKLSKRISTDIPMLESGIRFPIQARYDELKENGRTGTSDPNVQNWPREQGKDHPKSGPTVRECVVPRTGFLFGAADYSQIELRTLAQVCIKLVGYSKLGDALNADRDPHLEVGARLLGISYEEGVRRKKEGDKAIKDARQNAKPINFGFPGGMGAENWCELAKRDYGLVFTIEEGRMFKEVWMQTYPEMREYLSLIGRITEGGHAQVEQLFSGRIRGGLGYCDAANTFFSGLAADIAKSAGWLITKACYVDTSSVLWGSRPCIFSHDEFIVEVPEWKAHDCAEEIGRLMVAGGQPWLPDVVCKAEPLLMSVWSKDAETKRDASGRLIPWSP